MCGIVAILARRGPASARNLDRALDAMPWRGPDATGRLVRWDGALLLGHRLLSIMDSSRSSAQPMVDPETGTALIFNGAIYNFPELRQELRANGIRFRTAGDTEVLLAAWRHWGEESFARLNGIWAIALHDPQRDRVIVSRDRLGVKPLYLHDDGRTLALASTVNATLAAAGARAEPDDTAIFDYLLTGHSVFPGRSFHAGVVPVPPGACWRIRRDGGIETGRYHDWSEDIAASAVTTESVRELMLDAVRQRLRSAVPTGLLLSGGLDSSIVAWAAGTLERRGEPGTRHFFSYGYTDNGDFDETGIAARTADQLCPNATHEVLKVGSVPDAEDIGAMLAGQEEPVSTPSVIATFRMYRHMHARGFRVALTGEGSDELFAGYTRRYLPILARDSLRQGRLGHALRLLSAPALDARGLAKRLAWSLPRPLLAALLARQEAATGVIAPAFRQTMRHRLDEEIRRRRDPLASVLRRDVTRDLLPMILRYADRNGMAASMEIRSPFLDYRLVALALALPLHRKIGPAGGKLILREAFAGILPDQVVQAPKRLGMGHAEQFNAAALPLAPLLDSPPPLAERYIDLARLRACLEATPNEPMLWRPINLLFFLHGLHRRETATENGGTAP